MARNQFSPTGFAVHVNGPCLLSAKAGGSNPQGTLQQVGISEEGFEIMIRHYDQPIFADTSGKKIPIDLLEMGMDAEIRGSLVIYDQNALTNWFRILGNEPSEGQLPGIGSPIGLSGNSTCVVLSSPFDEPWRFLNCRCKALKFNRSTRQTIYQLEIYAFALIGVNPTSLGVPLYDHNPV